MEDSCLLVTSKLPHLILKAV